MTGMPRRYLTGIESSDAILPEPPRLWSYSSLRDAGACPRRYVLSRATYPDLWPGSGYPRRPSAAALYGDVVHGALEKIVKALTADGCDSPRSAGAVGALRRLGGYTAVIEAVTEDRLNELDDGNPRVSADLQHRIARDLRERIPDARAQVQTYVSKSALGPTQGRASGAGTGGAAGDGRAALPPGAHPEVRLVALDLRLAGRVDLLRLDEGGASITDYKTGAEDPGHRSQLETYALLWDLDRDANPCKLPVTGLTASYPGRDVTFPPPDDESMRAIEESLAARITEADTELAAPSPRAVPTAENCGTCEVRQLCNEYWENVAPDPSGLADQERFDCQGTVLAANGPRGWWVRREPGSGPDMLIQASRNGPGLTAGDRVRILGLRAALDPDSDTTVAMMSSATEVFKLTSHAPAAG